MGTTITTALPIDIHTSVNIVSTNNSSSALLLANATFTGVFENVLQYQEVSMFSSSDVSGSLFLDISNDGITTVSSFSFPSSVSASFRGPISTQFARVRYVNGAVAQSSFSLTTIYRPVIAGTVFVPMSSSIFDASSGSSGRSILFGKNASGTYVMVPTDTDTGLRITGSLGTALNKTNVNKTGALTTTTTTVDQVVLTYTVTSGKTFYLQYVDLSATQTTPAGGTAVVLGTISLETPSGTKIITRRMIGAGAMEISSFSLPFAEPLPIASGTVVRVVVTPAATSSFNWNANFGGYEK
jgi:hypothetical protein